MARAAGRVHASRAAGAGAAMGRGDAEAGRKARRLCAARIVAAAAALSGRPSDEAVHRARRELKRARALLRLVRAGLPAEAFGAVNSALRDVGRLLGAARDAAVLRDLARETAATAGVPPAALTPLVARFDRERRARRSGIDVPRARATLATARAQLRAARLEEDGAMLAAGFVRVYRRGRRAYAAARDAPHPARLHSWRRHVKHYWHALETLEPAWPRLMTALAAEAHRLADVLGAHHDCTLLAARLESAALTPALRRRLTTALAKRRSVLRARAFAIGERLYEERPRRLAPRAALWWRHWVDASHTEPQQPAGSPAPVHRRHAKRRARIGGAAGARGGS
jgi:CHAD domain-containing protein